MNKTRAGLGAVLTGGLLATSLASASPATAVSDELTYTCPTALGPQTFLATLDSDAPDTIAVGQTVDTITTATVTIPSTLTGVLVQLGAVTYTGTSGAVGYLDGVESPIAMDVVPGAVADPLVVTATGSSGQVTGTAVGQVLTMSAGNFVSRLKFLTSDGADALAVLGGSPAITCALTEGQDTVVDVITVTKAGSSTEEKAVYKPRKDRVVSRAAVTGEYLNDPAGDVKMVLKRGDKVIRKATVPLNAEDVARAGFDNVRKRGRYSVVATYLGSDRLERSKDTATFRVR